MRTTFSQLGENNCKNIFKNKSVLMYSNSESKETVHLTKSGLKEMFFTHSLSGVVEFINSSV